MSEKADEPVKIRLLDREFMIACADEERPGLIAAADLIDKQLRELRNKGGTAGFDRLLAVVALNLGHELVGLREARQQVDEGIASLTRKLEEALAGNRAKRP